MPRKGGEDPCAVCGYGRTAHVKRTNPEGTVLYLQLAYEPGRDDPKPGHWFKSTKHPELREGHWQEED